MSFLPYRRISHGDRHQMENFSALLAIGAGNSPVTAEFPVQRPVTRSFDVFFDLRLNKQLSKQSWGSWFETHFDVIVMGPNRKTQYTSIRHVTHPTFYIRWMRTHPIALCMQLKYRVSRSCATLSFPASFNVFSIKWARLGTKVGTIKLGVIILVFVGYLWISLIIFGNV